MSAPTSAAAASELTRKRPRSPEGEREGEGEESNDAPPLPSLSPSLSSSLSPSLSPPRSRPRLEEALPSKWLELSNLAEMAANQRRTVELVKTGMCMESKDVKAEDHFSCGLCQDGPLPKEALFHCGGCRKLLCQACAENVVSDAQDVTRSTNPADPGMVPPLAVGGFEGGGGRIMKSCPFCRLSRAYLDAGVDETRKVLWECILFRCKHCSTVVTADSMADHLSHSCTRVPCVGAGLGCAWSGPTTDVSEHQRLCPHAMMHTAETMAARTKREQRQSERQQEQRQRQRRRVPLSSLLNGPLDDLLINQLE